MKSIKRRGDVKEMTVASIAALLLAALPQSARAQSPVPVTVDNIIRAGSDAVFTGLVAQGGFGKFYHSRGRPQE